MMMVVDLITGLSLGMSFTRITLKVDPPKSEKNVGKHRIMGYLGGGTIPQRTLIESD